MSGRAAPARERLDGVVRVCLAWAVLLAGCAPAYDPEALFRGLQSNDLETREEASDTMEKLVRQGDYKVFLRGLDSPNGLLRAQSIVFLARMTQPEARRALRDLLRIEKRMMLPYNPIRMKPSSELSDSRILVAHLIAAVGKDPDAVGALLQGMDQEQPAEVVIGTCFAVGALGDPRGIPYLVKSSGDRNVEVVRAAVQALTQFQGPDALAALERLASHPALEVRIDVLSGVSQHKEDAALDLLKKMGLSDPSPDVRAAAIRGLMQNGNSTLTPYLIDCLRTGDEMTRAAAQEVLHRVTGRALGSRPDAWSKWWSESQARSAQPR